MPEKILLIDGDRALTQEVALVLSRHHYAPIVAHDGISGLNAARRAQPSLIILDVVLPLLDGWEVCRKLRAAEETHLTPIIMASARAQEQDRLAGFEVGADDYLPKPFSLRELLARIKAIERRFRSKREAHSTVLCVGDLHVDVARHTVKVRQVLVHLTVTEFAILHRLALEPGRVFSRDQLLTALGGDNCSLQEHNLDVHIHAIRKKIEPFPLKPRYIQTIRRIGFKLTDSPSAEMPVHRTSKVAAS